MRIKTLSIPQEYHKKSSANIFRSHGAVYSCIITKYLTIASASYTMSSTIYNALKQRSKQQR